MSDMKRGVKILNENGNGAEFHLCQSRKHTCIEKIDTVYSQKHARDLGWKVSSQITFCPPTMPHAWVCPECASKYDWK